MRYTVRCDDEPVGYVELEVSTRPVAAPLLPLPAFERIRPALDQQARALMDGARRLYRARQAGLGATASLPETTRPPEGAMVASRIDPDLAKHLDLESLHAAGEAARRLHFTLHDPSGTRIEVRSVSVSTWPGSAKAPDVSVIFGT